MSSRWRPSFRPGKKGEIEDFLERHPNLPFSDAKEFAEFAIDNMIMEYETAEKDIEQAALEKIKEDLDLE